MGAQANCRQMLNVGTQDCATVRQKLVGRSAAERMSGLSVSHAMQTRTYVS